MSIVVKIYNFLKGKKCYLIGLACIGYGIYECTEAQVAAGIEDIKIGALVMAGRAAISKGVDALRS
jgi:hypothetical protein